MTARGEAETAGKLDLRGLEPPEPMRRALEAVEALEVGGTLEVITDREPKLLQRELERRMHTFASTVSADGCMTVIRRGPA